MLLVEEGADINTPDHEHNTPLMIATENGRVEIARFMIEKGADIEWRNKYGMTPLLWASRQLQVEILRMLVLNGANVDVTDKQGRCPLDLVMGPRVDADVREERDEIATFLKRHGARPRTLKEESGSVRRYDYRRYQHQ